MTAGYSTRHLDLASSVAFVNARQDRLRVHLGIPDEPGWTTSEDFLSDPDAVPAWRADLARWMRDTYGEAPERTVAAYLMSWYLLTPGFAAGLLFHHARRVPSLRPENVAFHRAMPMSDPDAVALLSPSFTCLPDDPAADSPHAVVVADELALAAVLRGRFRSHAARFIAVFGPRVRLGNHTLWGAATDALDNAFWLAGRYNGDEAAGALDAALVLGAGHSPFTSASTLRPTAISGGSTEWTRRRESCCFHYLLEQGSGECSTCPRLCRKR
ncbi:(2Fe-2S)-binding protein [Actinokineospora xionganensis]|uniref:(2Fe-2S)-binding protein n=1 Tax=Actinokineospora xionganensis TaxID=2684470 RepID=A0ABR7L397_9PSEU|nr:(2Fe-2S)-binding protein [Actinokineospora xionganensis]MBC6447057.1 (2Fe-2S)-binding protein [Actinokineospora xionganensis]